jgi:hypothetical protein
MFELVDEHGVWMTNLLLGVPDWKPGDRILRGHDTLEVVEVRSADDLPVLVSPFGTGPKKRLAQGGAPLCRARQQKTAYLLAVLYRKRVLNGLEPSTPSVSWRASERCVVRFVSLHA